MVAILYREWVFRVLGTVGATEEQLTYFFQGGSQPTDIMAWSNYLLDNYSVEIIYNLRTESTLIWRIVEAASGLLRSLLGEWKKPTEVVRRTKEGPILVDVLISYSEP